MGLTGSGEEASPETPVSVLTVTAAVTAAPEATTAGSPELGVDALSLVELLLLRFLFRGSVVALEPASSASINNELS